MAPVELHPDAVKFRERIKSIYMLDDAATGLLNQATENLSIALYAQETVRKEGMTFRTKTNYVVAHPCMRIAEQASALFSRQLHLIGLDIEATAQG